MTDRKRIVIVDDDPDVVERITQLLEDDYEVESTIDWAQLSTIFFRKGIDLLLMDVNLPVIQGDELVGILNSARKDKNKTCIVFFSSEDEETMRRLVLKTGADGYLSKSLRGAELLARIAAYLEA